MQDGRPLLILSPNLLGETLPVVLDDPTGSLHNRLTATIIHIQKHSLCLWIILLKMKHNLRLRTPEPVDGLVVVSYDEQIILRSCKHADNIVLEPVDILELVHQNIPELPLPGPQDILPLL